MADIEEDLRATAEDLQADAKRLARIEAEKVTLDPGDPRLTALAAEATELGKGIAAKTKAEETLAKAAESGA